MVHVKVNEAWRPDIFAMLSSTFTGTNDKAPAPIDPLDSAIFPALQPWFSALQPKSPRRPRVEIKEARLEKIKAFGSVYLNSLKVPQKLHSVAADYAENCTAMLEAAAMGRSQLLKLEELLVKKHCNANFVNGEGFCALHSATFNGHLLTVKMLMRHHAKVNLPSTNPDYIGWTALHFAACSSDDLELIQYLLLNGADPTAKTADGDTPYSLAVVTGKPEAVTQKLLGGDLLQAELKKLGLFQRLQPILQANAIDTIDDLNDLTLTELMSLQDKGGVTKITREEALQIWKCRHPAETMLAFGAVKLLLGLIAIWIFLHVVQFLLGVSIIS